MRHLRRAAAVVGLVLALGACTAAGATTVPPTPAPPATPSPRPPSSGTPPAMASAPGPSASSAYDAGRYSGGDYGAIPTKRGGPASARPGPPGEPAASPLAAGAVTIIDFAFEPASLTVKVGATVTWTNAGAAAHTVMADHGSFESGTVGSGGTFTQAFTTAGSFAYHCRIHASMRGTIVVRP